MPRRGKVIRHRTPPDAKYNSIWVQTMINKIMKNGKKGVAERIVYRALDEIGERTKEDPRAVFEKAMRNVMPVLEVRPRRVGGATYQVPVEVRPDRRVSLGMRWLVQYARSRSGKTMRDKLAAEILDASNNTGSAVKRREDTHKMAEANKAFAHYRW